MVEYKSNFNLEERTASYSKLVIDLSMDLVRDLESNIFRKQLVRSGTSVGANYIEANEAFSDKDFLYRLRICRKEAKESDYWLKLIKHSCLGYNTKEINNDIDALIDETNQLIKIFSTIILNKEKQLNQQEGSKS